MSGGLLCVFSQTKFQWKTADPSIFTFLQFISSMCFAKLDFLFLESVLGFWLTWRFYKVAEQLTDSSLSGEELFPKTRNPEVGNGRPRAENTQSKTSLRNKTRPSQVAVGFHWSQSRKTFRDLENNGHLCALLSVSSWLLINWKTRVGYLRSMCLKKWGSSQRLSVAGAFERYVSSQTSRHSGKLLKQSSLRKVFLLATGVVILVRSRERLSWSVCLWNRKFIIEVSPAKGVRESDSFLAPWQSDSCLRGRSLSEVSDLLKVLVWWWESVRQSYVRLSSATGQAIFALCACPDPVEQWVLHSNGSLGNFRFKAGFVEQQTSTQPFWRQCLARGWFPQSLRRVCQCSNWPRFFFVSGSNFGWALENLRMLSKVCTNRPSFHFPAFLTRRVLRDFF